MSRRPIWKVKRKGRDGTMKQIGSWHFTAPGGVRINTRTDDANKALKFRERWLQKNPPPEKAEVQGAAEATIAALDATPETSTAPDSGAPPLPDSPAAAPVAHPDAYIPPPDFDSGDWATDASRAAAGAAAPAEPDVDPAFLNDLLDDAATMLVEAQIMAQTWAAARGLKLKTAHVPPDNRGRTKGKEIWAKQLQKWMPSDIDIPGYLAAPLVVAAHTVPVQLGPGCMPLPPPDEKKTKPGQVTTEAVGVDA